MIADASVAVKWIKDNEEDRDKALQLLKNHLTGKEKITVPSLFFIEIANSLVTKSETLPGFIEERLKFIYSRELEIYEPKAEDLIEAALSAKKYKTSVYDMLYAVVAKKHKTFLVTADKRFVKKTNLPYIKLLSA